MAAHDARGVVTGPSCRGTRNQAAYRAGTNSKVSPVAAISPPMIATACGPKNTLVDNGTIAYMAVAAVRTMGRKRRTVAWLMASKFVRPDFRF